MRRVLARCKKAARAPEPDFLDEMIAERTKENPEFPALVEKALKERRAKQRREGRKVRR